MAEVLGYNAKLYINTGTYGAPTWVEVTNVKDCNLQLQKGEVDVTTRAGNGWDQMVPATKNGTVSFGMIWDTADTNFTAIKDAFFNDTLIDVAVMDGDIAASGSQGLRAEMHVFGFDRNEPLKEALDVPVTMKPGRSTNAPQWMEIV